MRKSHQGKQTKNRIFSSTRITWPWTMTPPPPPLTIPLYRTKALKYPYQVESSKILLEITSYYLSYKRAHEKKVIFRGSTILLGLLAWPPCPSVGTASPSHGSMAFVVATTSWYKNMNTKYYLVVPSYWSLVSWSRDGLEMVHLYAANSRASAHEEFILYDLRGWIVSFCTFSMSSASSSWSKTYLKKERTVRCAFDLT